MAADALIRMGCGDEVERWLDGYIPDKAPARRWQIDEEDWREVIGVTSRLGDWCALTCEPYKSADRVFWVVDNGSSHRGRKAIDRLAKQFPNAIMVHTPVHASWLNQVEIVFSVVQRKVLTPNNFDDLSEVIDRLANFEERYNQAAKPFKWKFTTTDLADFLTRLDQHQPAEPRAA